MTKPLIITDDQILIPYLYDCGHMVCTRTNTLGQVFSYVETDTGIQRHYDIEKLLRLAREINDIGTVELTEADALFVLKHSGIEDPHLARLTAAELYTPGIIVRLANSTDIIADGNHRLVRRYQLGAKTMDFYIIGEVQAKAALLALPEAEGHKLAIAGKRTTP